VAICRKWISINCHSDTTPDEMLGVTYKPVPDDVFKRNH
jgi:hypothetical protein